MKRSSQGIFPLTPADKLQVAETILPKLGRQIIVVNVKFLKLRPVPKTRNVSVNRSFPPVALLIRVLCISA